MNWKNLTINKCPRDGQDLLWDTSGRIYCSCGFEAGNNKISHLVSKMVEEEIEEEHRLK